MDSRFDPPSQYDIADAGTEEMWINDDGTPYLYYTGPSNRYCGSYQYNTIIERLRDIIAHVNFHVIILIIIGLQLHASVSNITL